MILKLGILLLTGYVCGTEPDCECPRINLPVCGSDGETYDSECYLTCARTPNSNLTVAHRGKCAAPPCVCTLEYKPVCGSDDVTYPNPCVIGCASGIQLKHTGPCEREFREPGVGYACNRDAKPVCGSDGRTYSNLCVLNHNAQSKSGLTLAHLGPCEQVVAELPLPSACTCTRNLSPVCGSDGETYGNACVLACAALKKPLLVVKSAGPCGGYDTEAVEQARSEDI